MKKLVYWVVSSGSAGIIINGLYHVLPEMTKHDLLFVGGLAAILWMHLIVNPLEKWSSR